MNLSLSLCFYFQDRTTVSGKPDTPNLEVSHIGDNFVNITIVKANTNNPGSVFYAQVGSHFRWI